MAIQIDYKKLARCRAKDMSVAETCAALGIKNSTFYYRIKTDEDFQNAWNVESESEVYIDDATDLADELKISDDEARVLVAIGGGAARHHEIQQATGFDHDQVISHLDKLIADGIVTRHDSGAGLCTFQTDYAPLDPLPVPPKSVPPAVAGDCASPAPDPQPADAAPGAIALVPPAEVAELPATSDDPNARFSDRDWLLAQLLLLYQQFMTGGNCVGLNRVELLNTIEPVLNFHGINPLMPNEDLPAIEALLEGVLTRATTNVPMPPLAHLLPQFRALQEGYGDQF